MEFANGDCHELEEIFREHLLENILATSSFLKLFFWGEQQAAKQPENIPTGWTHPIGQGAVRKSVGLPLLPDLGPLEHIDIIKERRSDEYNMEQWQSWEEWETPEDSGSHAEDVLKRMLSGKDPVGLFDAVCFIAVGLRYYVNQRKECRGDIMQSIPEILAVDRCIFRVINDHLHVYSSLAPSLRKNEKRDERLRKSGNDKTAATWGAIKAALREFTKKEKGTKAYSISGIAGDLRLIDNNLPKQDRIINLFKNKLGKDVMGKSYYLHQIISMCDKK